MKLWILGLSVCLLATSKITAQSAGNSMQEQADLQRQRLVSTARQFALEHLNEPAGAYGRTEEPGTAISIQRLQHHIDKRAHVLSKRGMREYFSHRYTDALPFLLQAVVIDPQSSVFENNLGVIYCALGKDQEAKKAFEEAVKADDADVVSYSNLAAVAFNMREYGLAESAARRALRLAPLSPEASVMLGLAEVAQNHWTAQARQLLEDYCSRFSQAKLILEHWPSGENSVLVKGAGPGSFARTAPQRGDSSSLPQ